MPKEALRCSVESSGIYKAQFHNQRKAVCKQQGCLQSYHEYGIFIAFFHNIAWILPGK